MRSGEEASSEREERERDEQKSTEEPKSDKGPALRDDSKNEVIRMIERDEVYQKFVEGLPARSDFEIERMMQEYLKGARGIMGWSHVRIRV